MFKNIVTVIFLLCACGIMLKLGFWQLDRLEWKTKILSQIEQQKAISPFETPLELNKNIPFQRGYLDGRFSPISPITLSPRTHNGQSGHHVLDLFYTNDGHAILVNLGWIGNKQDIHLPSIMPGRLVGYLQTPDQKNSFTPSNRPENHLWYWADMNALQDYFKVDEIYPRILYLESPIGNTIIAFDGLPSPRNKHAQYALFWFGMSGLLILLTGFFIYRRQKTGS